MNETVDTLVIGGGMSGLPLSLRAARHGSTMLVEEKLLGGTCLNRGCIPTKTMIASAKVAHQARRAGEFGVHAGNVSVDLPAVVGRKDAVVDGIRSGSYRAVGSRAGLEFVNGSAQLVGSHAAAVDGRRVDARRLVLAAGTRPTIPPIEGLDTVAWLDSTSMLDVRELPRHLVVIGGGYVGVEFAQMFRRFGSGVTVLQRAKRVLPGEDEDISAGVAAVFGAEGIDIALGAEVVAVEPAGSGVRVTCANGTTCEGSHLLLAAGRTPNSDTFGLESTGIEPDGDGFVPVDAQLRTPVEDVFAFGDLTGPPMFTHTARDDADVLYRSAFRGEDASIEGRVVPHAVFSDPEVGAVGMTEAQARAAGYDVVVGKADVQGVARARAIGETRGMLKFVVDGANDRILGAHFHGPEAAELVHEAVVAMVGGIPYHDIARAIHIHPTLAEGVNAAAGGVHRPVA